MRPAVNIILALSILSAASIAAGWVLSYSLIPERRHPQLLRPLITWSVKGLLVPLAIWALMNLGLSWNLQPFMPQVQAAQNNGGAWFPEYLRALEVGFFVISTYWTSVTLSWFLIEAGAGATPASIIRVSTIRPARVSPSCRMLATCALLPVPVKQ